MTPKVIRPKVLAALDVAKRWNRPGRTVGSVITPAALTDSAPRGS